MKKKLNYKKVIHSDAETGEYICTTEGVTTIEDNQPTPEEIKRQEFLEKWDTDFNKGARFVKVYDKALEVMVEKLSKSELQFAMKIVKLVSYDDSILRTGGHGNGKVLSLNDIAEITEESYKNCSKLMNALLKQGIVGKHETGCVGAPNIIIKCYTFNPYILNRGKKLDKTVEGLFHNTGWERLSSEDRLRVFSDEDCQ